MLEPIDSGADRARRDQAINPAALEQPKAALVLAAEEARA